MRGPTWSRVAIGAVIVAVVAGVIGLAAHARRAARAERASDRTVVDVGVVVQGDSIDQVFAVPNTGASALVIQRVTPNVGAVTRVDSVIPPDAVGRIGVRVATGSMLGVVNAIVKVEFAGNRPPEWLRVRARVVPPVELAPQDRVYFFTVTGEAPQREVLIINHLHRPLKVLGITSSNSHFRTALRTLEAGRRYQLTVTLDPATAAGPHKGTIRVTTDSPDYPSLALQGLALVRDVVSASLSALDYARIERDALDRKAVSERTVLVQKYHGTGFRVLGAATDVPFMTVEVVPQQAGESYLVHVRIDPERAPRGKFRGTLRIETNDHATPEFRLPITGEIL